LLTEDIVAFSRISTDEPATQVDLNEILAIVVNSLQRKIQDNEAVINYKALPQINGYPLLITILFTHLIDNALKFRKPDLKPVVDIESSVVNGDSIEHSSAIKDIKYIVISVIDNGLGFEKHEGEKIFTMFYRIREKGKAKGSGIGLAICKKIMDLHNGFIASECNPDCTTFRCFFPLEKN
jgi:signal transduction histidine kinase